MALDMAQTSNEVKTIIKGWMDSRVSNIHTAMPGQIVSYNPSTNRASVQPNGNYKAEDGRDIRYPIIHNVPIQFPMGQGGTAGITFPINPGDGCLLVFSETQNDDFLCNNKGDSPDVRRHSLNDAIAIFISLVFSVKKAGCAKNVSAYWLIRMLCISSILNI